MISIITSSYRPNLFESLKENIKSTIGDTEYELIRINNPELMSVSQAYNKGANQARYDILLFVHEDIEFKSSGWGDLLVAHLKLDNVGIVGVAGSLKRFNLPIGFETGIKKYRRIYLKHDQNENIKSQSYKDPVKVRTLDGVFMALTNNRWKEFKFNELIDGFHFYDLDLSLRISEKYQNYVAQDILIVHKSLGKFNNAWINAVLKFHSIRYRFDEATEEELNYMRRYWYLRLRNEDISLVNRIRYILKMGVNRQSKHEALKFLITRPKK